MVTEDDWKEAVRLGLRSIMRDKGLGQQADLARALQMPQRQASNYLNKKAVARPSTLRKYCRNGELSYDKYFSTEGQSTSILNSDQNLLDEFAALEIMRAMPKIYEFLRRETQIARPLYLQAPQEMMTRELRVQRKKIQIPIPATVLTRACRIKLNTPPSPSTDERDHRAQDSDYYKKVRAVSAVNAQRLGRNLEDIFFNSRAFTMEEISVKGDDCTITGSISDYFSMLATHYAMEHELLSKFEELPGSDPLPVNFGDRLLRRRKFRSLDTKAKRRHAVLSISTLLVYKTKKDKYKVMIGKRDGNVAVYPNLFHVIPVGVFQPELDVQKEWNIQHCLIKEYSEELFSERVEDNRPPLYMYEEWQSAIDLVSALKVQDCRILHSGVALNLLNFLPEICCVLLVENADWYEKQSRKFRTNWEYVPRRRLMNSDFKARTDYDLDDVEEQFLENITRFNGVTAARITSEWVPFGLASFWLGIDAVREHLNHQTRHQRPAVFTPINC